MKRWEYHLELWTSWSKIDEFDGVQVPNFDYLEESILLTK